MICLVRYSDRSFFDSLEQEPEITVCNSEKIGDVTEFNRIWPDFMEDMFIAASSRRYAAKVSPLMGFQRIYALMQCIPGSSSISCDACLR
ncbi:hypothetical protein ARALYDRAFT_911496 [Arabidopsis lyrata subsp. lyrata]|uniref:Gnk2-homologous domain-containing protein n=1 Tax=Arabidopsis lyrata subsp. lyrata TaxID=81972 RepID=D7LZL7_ARALL|nr:hypothetical protein ARALYDRAFT_911496 [Arabidopsis lyrata subsp. lyrata]